MPIATGYLRCECSKIHTLSLISQTSVCTCGRLLWPQRRASLRTTVRKDGA